MTLHIYMCVSRKYSSFDYFYFLIVILQLTLPLSEAMQPF